MIERLYQWITALTRRFGLWVFLTYLWIVATGFFLMFPSRVAASVRFYRALFPEKPFWGHFLLAWKQYHHFTTIFLDKFLVEESGDISYSAEGWRYLQDALDNKTGAIILMSHLGNWEMAAYLLKIHNPAIRMLLYMGKRETEQMERIQKENLFRSGVTIIALDQDAEAPYEILEGVRYLRSGGIVSMTGDRVWHKDQKTISVRFLDHEARLPEIPHALARITGAPLHILFAFRTGRGAYHFSLSPPIYVRCASRSERRAAVEHSAQQYANFLESAAREYPVQWYHFGSFPGRELK